MCIDRRGIAHNRLALIVAPYREQQISVLSTSLGHDLDRLGIFLINTDEGLAWALGQEPRTG